MIEKLNIKDMVYNIKALESWIQMNRKIIINLYNICGYIKLFQKSLFQYMSDRENLM